MASSREEHERVIKEALEALAEFGSHRAAAAALGIPRSTIRSRISAAGRYGVSIDPPSVEVPELPDPDLDAESILEYRERRFKQIRNAHAARQWMPFRVNTDGPFGLAFVGDPHIDDNGCNIPLLRHDLQLIQDTEGLWGVGLGDYTSNWSGRLQRLYAEQEMTRPQAWKVAEWFFGLKKSDGSSIWWLLIKGNHDLWSGSSDPLDWMERGAAPLEDWRATVKVVCANKREFKLDVAHNHPGHSIYNPGHGPMRRAKFTGAAADVYIAGDKHNWFCAELEDQENLGRVYWAVRCRGYKYIDDYAWKIGYGDQEFGATITAIFDPEKSGPEAVRCFPHLGEAVEFLTWKRARR